MSSATDITFQQFQQVEFFMFIYFLIQENLVILNIANMNLNMNHSMLEKD
jgi:hypothetical protein